MKIPVKVYSEVKNPTVFEVSRDIDAANLFGLIEWVDNKGINTPYVVSWTNL